MNGRTLLDRWDRESVLEHMREHDEHNGGTISPASCDHCFVRPMLPDLLEVWRSGNATARQILWSIQDGYGSAGETPEQGPDWSGIRDSTPATVERMWQAVHA